MNLFNVQLSNTFSRKSKVPLLKSQNFHAKLTCQNLMLRQVEWGAQNGPIAKNADFPRTT